MKNLTAMNTAEEITRRGSVIDRAIMVSSEDSPFKLALALFKNSVELVFSVLLAIFEYFSVLSVGNACPLKFLFVA